MYCIGVDPGVHTGVAVWSKKRRALVDVFTTDFWGLIEYLNVFDKRTIRVYVENPNFNAPVFEREHLKNNPRAKLRNAQDVGKNKAHGLLIIAYCERHGIQVVPVRPGKHTESKLTTPQFKQRTKYTGLTNQHGRDAAMLVFGY